MYVRRRSTQPIKNIELVLQLWDGSRPRVDFEREKHQKMVCDVRDLHAASCLCLSCRMESFVEIFNKQCLPTTVSPIEIVITFCAEPEATFRDNDIVRSTYVMRTKAKSNSQCGNFSERVVYPILNTYIVSDGVYSMKTEQPQGACISAYTYIHTVHVDRCSKKKPHPHDDLNVEVLSRDLYTEMAC